jgi:acetyl-CoA carboxylase biotin carboxyl carrier protein
MDLDKVQALLRIVNESGVAEVEVEEEGFRLVIRRTSATVTLQPAPMPYPMPMMAPMQGMPMQGMPMQGMPMQGMPSTAEAPGAPQHGAPQSIAATAAAAPAAEPGSGANEILVRAPIVGTFYRAPSPDADSFVTEGSRVSVDDTLCIIEAMKLMNEIKAEVSGTIKQILVENAQPVEYDQPLFVIET